MWINSGSIRNKGLEIDASFVPVATGGFEWIIGGNISFNRNTITSIGQDGSSGKIFLTKDKESESEVRYFGGDSINSESTEFLNINIEGYIEVPFCIYIYDDYKCKIFTNYTRCSSDCITFINCI